MKKNIYNIIILLLSIALLGCNVKRDDVLSTFNEKVMVIPDREVVLNEQLNPISFRLMGDVIVINTHGNDNYYFSIIDTVNFNHICRFGLIGKGPNELGAVTSVNRINNDSLLIVDGVNLNAYIYSIESILKKYHNPIRTISVRNNEGKARCLGLNMMSDGNMVGTGIHSEGRYAVYDKDGLIQNYFVPYPDIAVESNNALLQALAFQSVITKQPNGHKIASLSNGNQIDILKYMSNEKVYLARRLSLHSNDFKYFGEIEIEGVAYPQVATSIKSIAGLEDFHFQATDKYIFALFTSRPHEDFIGTQGHKSRRMFSDLLAFDWDGNPVIHYKLDREVFGFAVKNDNKRVFLLSYNDNDLAIMLCAYL